MSEIWDKPITDTTDWGGDSSTGGLPVSGRQVQAWLKSRIAKILTEAQITKIIEDWVQENGFADDEGFVTLSSDQEINGLKNFLQGLMVNGGLVKYDPELKVWQLTGNLLVSGGISMYSNLEGFKPSTIMDGILTDEVTITVKDGRLTVLAAESGLNYDELDAYLKKYEYTTISEVDARISELVNGAPQAYDTLKEIADVLEGNVNSIGDILATLAEKANTTYVDEAIADTKTWVEEQQYINEIDPSYIEAALGYQPYDGDTNRKEFTTKTYVKDNFVSRTLANEIEAIHNFLNGFNLAGIPFRKMANGSLFIDANVVFGGGATMYGTDTTPAPSIFDGLPIDNETIYWDGDVLKAMGGGGGGGVADSVAWANVYGKPTWITNTKPTYNYSEIQGTPDLSGYALASAIPTNNNKLTNGAGYITGITSSMVTAALGYTPLSTTGKAANAHKLGGLPPIYRKGEGCIPTITSGGVMEIGKYIDFHTQDEEEDVDYSLRIECQGANRNRVYFPTTTGILALTSDIPSLAGYATETFVNMAVNGAKEWVEEQQYLTEITSGMIESVLGYQPYDGDTNRLGFLTSSALNGYATQSWVNTALAGYLPLSGGTINGSLSIASGLTVSHPGASIVVKRTQNHAALIKYENSNGVLGQLGLNTNETILFIDASGNYRTLLDSGNYTNYALSKNGGTVNGALNMNASFQLGNNKPITVADADGVYQTALYLSSANNFIIGYGTSVVGKRKTVLLGNRIEFRSAGNENNTLVLNSDHSSEFLGKVTAPSFIGNLTGDTANIGTLQITTNEVNGANGTGNAHINYSSTGKVTIANGGGNVAIGGTTADAKLHVYGNIKTSGFVIADARMYSYGYLMTNTGLSYCGLVQNSLVSSVGDSRDIWLYNEYMTNICGRTGVSIDGASAGVTIKGNLLTTGGITMYSQRSLKNILSYEGLSLEQLSVIKPIKFTWKDGRDNRYHVGGVADDVATVVPEVVYSANDFLTMDYGNAGFYVAASLIKPVIDHETRIEQLENRVKQLENENKQLRQAS